MSTLSLLRAYKYNFAYDSHHHPLFYLIAIKIKQKRTQITPLQHQTLVYRVIH